MLLQPAGTSPLWANMDENDALSEYNKIPHGHNRTNGAVYSKIYFKVEICSAH